MKSVSSKGQEWNKEYMICGFAFVFILLLGVVGIYGCASETVKESGSKEAVFSKGNYAPGFARKLLTSNSTSDDYGGDGGVVSNGGDQGDGGDVSNGGDQGDGGDANNGGDQGGGGDGSNSGDQGDGGDGNDQGDGGDGGNNGGDGRTPNRIGMGYGSPCSKENILVFQGQTQPLPNGIPTYTVNIQNVCLSDSCKIANIHVRCGWFSTARLINPSVFRRVNYDDCLVKDGHPLNPGETLSFQYANTFKYPMSVSSVAC